MAMYTKRRILAGRPPFTNDNNKNLRRHVFAAHSSDDLVARDKSIAFQEYPVLLPTKINGLFYNAEGKWTAFKII